jgi:LysM repeat protein
MTERGLPIVDGASACPFVAFEDDRDERATSPDHRHRCYAEAQPAPRALAHQEAYCLSSAFPVCPTFQDWARREAARARPLDVPAGDADEDDEPPPYVDDRPPRRTTPGTWAAPPPWMRGSSTPGPAAQRPPDEGRPADMGAGAEGGVGAAAAHGVGGGLSGSFADRLLGGSGGGAPPPGPEWRQGDAWDDDLVDASDEPTPDDDEGAEPARAPGGRGAPSHADAPPPRRAARERMAPAQPDADERERDAWAPSWERPRRLEAYPTLRSRRFSGIGLPPILVGVVALLLAGAALFFLPSLLGIGNPPGGGSPTPGIAASAEPSGSVEPTLEPAATPFLYTVQSGDTFTKIAKKFGIPVGTLIAANAEKFPNPDVLKVGDRIIIPSTLPTEIPAASTAP